MAVIAGVATMMAGLRCLPTRQSHPNYWEGKAAINRRHQRYASQMAAAARAAAEASRHRAGTERWKAEADRWEEIASEADGCVREYLIRFHRPELAVPGA